MDNVVNRTNRPLKYDEYRKTKEPYTLKRDQLTIQELFAQLQLLIDTIFEEILPSKPNDLVPELQEQVHRLIYRIENKLNNSLSSSKQKKNMKEVLSKLLTGKNYHNDPNDQVKLKQSIEAQSILKSEVYQLQKEVDNLRALLIMQEEEAKQHLQEQESKKMKESNYQGRNTQYIQYIQEQQNILQDQNDHLQQKLDKETKYRDDLVSEYEERVSSLKRKLDELQQKQYRGDLSQSLRRSEHSKVGELQQENHLLQMALTELKGHYQQCQETQAVVEKECQQLQSFIRDQQEQLSYMKKEKEQLSVKISKNKSEQKSRDRSPSQISLSFRIEEVENQIRQFTEREQQYINDAKVLKKELDVLRYENQELRYQQARDIENVYSFNPNK